VFWYVLICTGIRAGNQTAFRKTISFTSHKFFSSRWEIELTVRSLKFLFDIFEHQFMGEAALMEFFSCPTKLFALTYNLDLKVIWPKAIGS
jgi:hypothetical protein